MSGARPRRRPSAANAFSLGMDMWLLGLDSAMVIGLRTLKLAAGDAEARTESERMIAEKIAAAAELPMVLAASGATSAAGLTNSALRHYSKKVRANRRRLLQPATR